eukprot:gnl/TRDRNA2_/TRDRNA2_91014_c0_seq1.p1 gnl/TRDRNA2_/TRDRNA2_91014_c0~~gnl/TRDRNA2_/TRDRNA2_91014_c0_seq1.p1  ORF type:complete len:483 (+),score=85.23 gnl/TRDRNA2_/TRDRNA2_91014_c0_seq1:46-1449(+)
MSRMDVGKKLESSLDDVIKSEGRGRYSDSTAGRVGKRCYVGNLAFSTTWQDLKDHFKPVGKVVYSDVMKDYDGRSKGCGIVEFETPEDASHAISSMQDSVLGGRPINVREDREDRDLKPSRQSDSYGVKVGRRCYVGNLDFKTNWQDLKDHFKQIGHVAYADVMRDIDGRSKGCGIVEFERHDDAAQAITELHDSDLGGRLIIVREDREDRDLKGGKKGGGKSGGKDSGKGYYAGGKSGSSMGLSRRCYVGNLAFEVTWQDLKDHFRQAGSVLYSNVMQDDSGRSKGCGIVEFESVGDASRAIKTLHDTTIKGRMITVREDREDKELGARYSGSNGYGGKGKGAGGGGYGRRDRSRSRSPRGRGDGALVGKRCYVGNLAFSVSWQDLKDHFRQVGNVVYSNVMQGNDGRSKGCGIVEFSTPREAARAIDQMHDSVLNGRPVTVREDREDRDLKYPGADTVGTKRRRD